MTRDTPFNVQERLNAEAACIRRARQDQLETMRTMVRILTIVNGKYRRGEVVPGLFGSETSMQSSMQPVEAVSGSSRKVLV